MKNIYLSVILVLSLLSLSGCNPSYSTEMTISLTPPAAEETAENQPDPIDPLDILAAVEKIASANDLQRYTPDTAETSLLDLADTDDLTQENDTKITHWQHTQYPVFLTVTRTADDILILTNHTAGVDGKPIPEAQKIYETLQKQLKAIPTNAEESI